MQIDGYFIFYMRRDSKYVRGRDRNKSGSRCRDLSADPKYRNKNYNKPNTQKSITTIHLG